MTGWEILAFIVACIIVLSFLLALIVTLNEAIPGTKAGSAPKPLPAPDRQVTRGVFVKIK